MRMRAVEKTPKNTHDPSPIDERGSRGRRERKRRSKPTIQSVCLLSTKVRLFAALIPGATLDRPGTIHAYIQSGSPPDCRPHADTKDGTAVVAAGASFAAGASSCADTAAVGARLGAAVVMVVVVAAAGTAAVGLLVALGLAAAAAAALEASSLAFSCACWHACISLPCA